MYRLIFWVLLVEDGNCVSVPVSSVPLVPQVPRVSDALGSLPQDGHQSRVFIRVDVLVVHCEMSSLTGEWLCIDFLGSLISTFWRQLIMWLLDFFC